MMGYWKKVLGPGVLFAATAIGVSHLVQSTSAGANFGLSLLIFVALANVLKFPFFEYGSRYASATNTSIIEGYFKLSKWWLYTYLIITFCSMFFVTAAVGVVTIGFMENLFGLNEITGINNFTHYFLFSIGLVLLLWGQFNALENVVKILGIILLITTIISFFFAIKKGPATTATLFPEMNPESWAFLLPLMGWMPTAIDLSAWNSLWTVEKIKESGYRPSVRQTVREFNFGYWISALLAFLFLFMGAFLVYGTGMKVPTKGAEFSSFVIDLYTESIGKWASLIISIAAFSIMLSTFITILDGYSRAIKVSFELALPRVKKNKIFEIAVLLVLAVGGLAIILIFENNPDGFRLLVNTATTISFIVAPVIAILNFRLVMPDKIGQENAPNRWMKVMSYLGIIYLFVFLIWFVIYTLF